RSTLGWSSGADMWGKADADVYNLRHDPFPGHALVSSAHHSRHRRRLVLAGSLALDSPRPAANRDGPGAVPFRLDPAKPTPVPGTGLAGAGSVGTRHQLRLAARTGLVERSTASER